MTAVGEKLAYVLRFLSPRTVLNETGLNTQMQKEVISGDYYPSGVIRRYVNTIYQKTSYTIMRDTGFSHSQAFRFAATMPTSVQDKITNVNSVISRLAGGAAKQSLKKQGITYDVYQHQSVYQDMYEKVKTGITYSRKVYEDWLDYGTKKEKKTTKRKD